MIGRKIAFISVSILCGNIGSLRGGRLTRLQETLWFRGNGEIPEKHHQKSWDIYMFKVGHCLCVCENKWCPDIITCHLCCNRGWLVSWGWWGTPMLLRDTVKRMRMTQIWWVTANHTLEIMCCTTGSDMSGIWWGPGRGLLQLSAVWIGSYN